MLIFETKTSQREFVILSIFLFLTQEILNLMGSSICKGMGKCICEGVFDLVPEMSVKLVFKECDLYVLKPTILIY